MGGGSGGGESWIQLPSKNTGQNQQLLNSAAAGNDAHHVAIPPTIGGAVDGVGFILIGAVKLALQQLNHQRQR